MTIQPPSSVRSKHGTQQKIHVIMAKPFQHRDTNVMAGDVNKNAYPRARDHTKTIDSTLRPSDPVPAIRQALPRTVVTAASVVKKPPTSSILIYRPPTIAQAGMCTQHKAGLTPSRFPVIDT